MSIKSVMDTTATGRRRNRAWPEALKREIVAALFDPGSSVSEVARHYDVNANQVFNWRKLYGDDPRAPAMLSSAPPSTAPCARRVGAAMIPVPSGVRVWLAVGRTDMRRGMNGLALQVQEALRRDPPCGRSLCLPRRARRSNQSNLGMTVSACRSTPKCWRRVASFRRRLPLAWSGSRLRNWLICSTGSTGGTRVIPSVQSVRDRR